MSYRLSALASPKRVVSAITAAGALLAFTAGLITTSARAAHQYWDVTYPASSLVLFGNEGRGLPREIVARGDLSVRIPMRGAASSLNLSVAAGVLLYEILRQRQSGD